MSLRWFSEVGMELARHFAELEAARQTFDAERKAILLGLRRPLEEALEARGKRPAIELEKDAWLGVTMPCRYTEARKGAVAAGCYVGIDRWDEVFGFTTLIWFGMGMRRFRRLGLESVPASLADAIELSPSRLRTSHVDRCAYVRVASILPDEARFAFDAFVEEARRLPSLFDRADGWFAAAYARDEGAGTRNDE